MRQHTHQVPKKSADSILDEFLLSQQNQNNNKSPQRSPTGQETTNLKFLPMETSNSNGKPLASQRQQNMLFSISGSDAHHPRDEQYPDGANSSFRGTTSQIVHIQRRLIGIFFVYATIIVTLYLTYAVYSYLQQSQFRRFQQQYLVESTTGLPQQQAGVTPASSLAQTDEQSQPDLDVSNLQQNMKPVLEQLQTKLEGKIHLLERYIEMLALDLEDTKGRLKEREKCACSIGCSFNGTRFSDGQRWQHKCDTCTCRSGKISCAPRECPKMTDCDDPVQLPGRCCPTCMKKCKINNTLIRHGQSFRPQVKDGSDASSKQCKCYDGLIRCEPLSKLAAGFQVGASQKAKNKTLEYLKSILANPQLANLESPPAQPVTLKPAYDIAADKSS